MQNKHKRTNLRKAAYQMWDNSKIGSFDLVKNSFAAEPEQQKNTFITYENK